MPYPFYPQNYPQNYSQQIQPVSQNQNGIIWVQGEAGAKSYLVAPNTTVQLWDSESQTIYLKSADNMGMPTIKTLDYTIRDNSTHQNTLTQPESSFATKEDLEALADEIASIKKRIDNRPNKNIKKEGINNAN